MRLLKGLLLTFGLIFIVVNVNRYFIYNGNFEFHGFMWFTEQVSSFSGLSHTIETIKNISEVASAFYSADVEEFGVFLNFFKMVYYVFSIPVEFTIDIILNLVWVFRFLWL